jgi:hypothetical protein
VGTDDDKFIEILTRRSYAHLRLVFECYAKMEDFDIEKSIERETSSDFKRALLAVGESATGWTSPGSLGWS